MHENKSANAARISPHDVDYFSTNIITYLYIKIIIYRLKELGMKMEKAKVFG